MISVNLLSSPFFTQAVSVYWLGFNWHLKWCCRYILQIVDIIDNDILILNIGKYQPHTDIWEMIRTLHHRLLATTTNCCVIFNNLVLAQVTCVPAQWSILPRFKIYYSTPKKMLHEKETIPYFSFPQMKPFIFLSCSMPTDEENKLITKLIISELFQLPCHAAWNLYPDNYTWFSTKLIFCCQRVANVVLPN